MAELSQNELKAIKAHPVRTGLETFRTTFISRYLKSENANVTEVVDQLTSEASDRREKDVILDLILALQAQPAARIIRSRSGDGPLSGDIASFYARLSANQEHATHVAPLLKLVITQSGDVVSQTSDIDIWAAVLDLIARTRPISQPTTPPTSIPVSFDGTPITHSSASQQGGEQTRQLVEARIFEEIRHCTYRNVGGFFRKYFEGKEWTERGKDIYNAMKSRHVDGQWIDFPDPPEQNTVWEWLRSFQDEFLSDTQGTYYTTRATSDLTGAEAERQLDLFVKRRSDTTSLTHHWKDVQVIAEHKQSKLKGLKHLLLQLGRYMRDVFTAQPTRRFIHGFFLYGTTMELWVFDRSGPYSSGEFNIHEEPEQFIRAIAGYAIISDEKLGLNTFVKRDKEDLFITITEDANKKEKRI